MGNDVFLLFVALLLLRINVSKAYLKDSAERMHFEGYKVYRAFLSSLQDVTSIRSLVDSVEGIDIWHVSNSMPWTADVAIPPHLTSSFLKLAKMKDCRLEVLIDDLSKLIHYPAADQDLEENNSDAATSFLTNSSQSVRRKRATGSKFALNAYNSLSDINDWINDLQKNHPQIVKLNEIGTSYENRSIIKLTIGKSRSFKKPAVWIDAGIHSREWISISTGLYIINELIVRYTANDTKIQNLLNWVDFHIAPVVNPDGYHYSRQVNRLWRKTRSHNVVNIQKSKSTCVGVDANRNFNYFWGTVNEHDGGWCSDGFSGPKPMSECETRAIADVLKELQPNLMAFLTLHSYGQMWLAPWGYTKNKPSQYQRQHDMAVVAIDALQDVHGTPYSYGTVSDLLYPASGTSVDYAHGLNVTFSYAIELRPGETASHFKGFVLPEDQIIPTGEETFAAIITMVSEILNENVL